MSFWNIFLEQFDLNLMMNGKINLFFFTLPQTVLCHSKNSWPFTFIFASALCSFISFPQWDVWRKTKLRFTVGPLMHRDWLQSFMSHYSTYREAFGSQWPEDTKKYLIKKVSGCQSIFAYAGQKAAAVVFAQGHSMRSSITCMHPSLTFSLSSFTITFHILEIKKLIILLHIPHIEICVNIY